MDHARVDFSSLMTIGLQTMSNICAEETVVQSVLDPMKRPRCVDLFAGAGGFSIGLEMAGFKSIFAVEIDKDAVATYRANHHESEVFDQNIEELRTEGLTRRLQVRRGELELLVGGPPCQGFSTVGKKDSADPRNQLFKQYFRIVDALRPKFVAFENVTGFKRMYSGSVFAVVCEEFRRLGYDVEGRILNAVNFGVPQVRERTIVLGVPRGTRIPWPVETHDVAGAASLYLKPALTLEDALSDLPRVKSGEGSERYASGPRTDFQRLLRGANTRLSEHVGPNHGASLMRVIRNVPPGGCIKDIPKQFRPGTGFANTYARLWWDRPSTTITRNFGTPSSSRCIHPLLDRGLTTREGARLQSFPDDFKFVGTRTSKNLQIGNAVPPLLAKAIGDALRAALGFRKIERETRQLIKA